MEPDAPLPQPPMEHGIALINACMTKWTPDAAKALAAEHRAAGLSDYDISNELLNIAVRLLCRLEELGCDPDEELLALAVESGDATPGEYPPGYEPDDGPGEV